MHIYNNTIYEILDYINKKYKDIADITLVKDEKS